MRKLINETICRVFGHNFQRKDGGLPACARCGHAYFMVTAAQFGDQLRPLIEPLESQYNAPTAWDENPVHILRFLSEQERPTTGKEWKEAADYCDEPVIVNSVKIPDEISYDSFTLFNAPDEPATSQPESPSDSAHK